MLNDGYGSPVNPVGLIVSSFRPSDDATLFGFLIPSNMFAVTSLRQLAEMMRDIKKDNDFARQCDFVHETGVAVRITEHFYTVAYFFGVVGRIASHDDTHRPDKVETDVRTADTFACLAFIEVGVQRTQNQFAGILVDRIVYIDLFGEMIYRLVQEGKTDILNNLG